jgi:hypothetical protein
VLPAKIKQWSLEEKQWYRSAKETTKVSCQTENENIILHK